MSGGGGGDYDYSPSAGETVTGRDSDNTYVRWDGAALGMPYHENYSIDNSTGEKTTTGSGHF